MYDYVLYTGLRCVSLFKVEKWFTMCVCVCVCVCACVRACVRVCVCNYAVLEMHFDVCLMHKYRDHGKFSYDSGLRT